MIDCMGIPYFPLFSDVAKDTKLCMKLNVQLACSFEGQGKNNEATQKYCIQGHYSAVMAYSC